MEFLADFGSIERYRDESPCTSHKLEKLTKYRKSISPLSDDCLYKCQIQLFESLFKSAQRQKLTRLFYYSKRRQRACLSCIRVNWKWKVKSNIDWVLSIRREHPLSSSSNSLFFVLESSSSPSAINSMSENERTKRVLCVEIENWCRPKNPLTPLHFAEMNAHSSNSHSTHVLLFIALHISHHVSKVRRNMDENFYINENLREIETK